MREFELDDDFWPGVLAALRDEAPAARLRERWPACAELLEGLLSDAEREPLLVGFRLATHGRNPRLFAILTGAYLARSGVSTLVVDLSPDTRWLEQLLGADYKEGFVDHLRFGVPLLRCVRDTGLEGFSAMSGGAWFLTGSPLDDAPGFRAGLEALRRRHRAVIITVPPPLEAGDRTGIASLCGALVTVEEGGPEATLAGSERAVVRLKGNADAARDLAYLTHRFLGPLPTLLGGMTGPSGGRSSDAELDRRAIAGAADPAGADDVAFLEGFEVSGSNRREPSPRLVEVEARPARKIRFRPRPAMLAAVVGLGVILIAGFRARDVALDLIGGWIGEPRGSYLEPEGQTIALDPVPGPAYELPVDTATGGLRATVAADSTTPADSVELAGSALEDQRAMLTGGAGRPAPFTVHVGSYQSPAPAMRVVEGLEAMGYAATLAPVSIAGKGQWYRVYAGSFADSTQALEARDRLQSSDLIDEGVVRSAPWTFELGTYPSPEAARAEAAALREMGVAAYVIGRGPVRLYTGAYQSREEAELLAQTLQSVVGSPTVRLIMREE